MLGTCTRRVAAGASVPRAVSVVCHARIVNVYAPQRHCMTPTAQCNDVGELCEINGNPAVRTLAGLVHISFCIHGHNVLWFIGILFDFGANVADMHVNCPANTDLTELFAKNQRYEFLATKYAIR